MGIPWQNGVEVYQPQAVRRPVTDARAARILRATLRSIWSCGGEWSRSLCARCRRAASPSRANQSRAPAHCGRFSNRIPLLISSSVLLVTVTGWGLALDSEFRSSGLIGPSSIYAETARPDISIAKGDPFAASTVCAERAAAAARYVRRQKRSLRRVEQCAERAGIAAGRRRPRGPRVGLKHHRARLELF